MGSCCSHDDEPALSGIPPTHMARRSTLSKVPTKGVINAWIRLCEANSYGWSPVIGPLATDVTQRSAIKPSVKRQIEALMWNLADLPCRLTVNGDKDDERISWVIEPFPEEYRYHRLAVELRIQRYLDLCRLFRLCLTLLSWRQIGGHRGNPVLIEHGSIHHLYYLDFAGSLTSLQNSSSYQQASSENGVGSGSEDLYDVDLDDSHVIVYKDVNDALSRFPTLVLRLYATGQM